MIYDIFKTNQKKIVRQINNLKARFCQSYKLPFSDILSADYIHKVVEEETPKFRSRVFTPIVTLQAFISQVLSQDHSCRDAVVRVLADRIAQDETPCSQDTSPYCRARMRLPEKLITRLLSKIGRDLHDQSEEAWKWKGRSVKLVDGTTISMPDTPENQDAFPQVSGQKKGLGFPIVRLVKGVEKYPCIEQFQLSEMLNKHFFRLLVSLQSDVEHFPGGIQPFSKSHYGQGSIFGQADCQKQQK
ncbi:MAG: hypothetical protein WGN25_14955 [Candidatus Electrothrix sp. GW3-4]|uniref:hypothetical protein n=1 Tax=Candidatus Electrothrix sp. GW3-4 TaxID=3126740 RepID=UPI0030CD1706